MSTLTTQRLRELAARARTADEVVTKAPVRLFDLPGTPSPGRFALITLDNGFDHTKPNTFGAGGLAELSAALDEVERAASAGEIVGAGVTGKPFIFAVGADLKGVGALSDRDDALTIARAGHAVFRRLAELPVPSFAFVNGAAMGGGVEVALHCAYRTISSGVPALAMPECMLGLVPGWGGCTLLPRLIGPDATITLVIENPLNQNKMLRGPQAFELGVADAMFEPADFLTQSLRWAASVITGETKVERRQFDDAAWQAALSRGRAVADSKVHGAAPAPYRALEIIELARDGSLDEGFAAEDQALADLVMSDELRSGLYSFDLVQHRARRPAGAPDSSLARPVTKVGVVGAGLMAAQLALLFVRRLQVPVVLTDVDQGRLDKGIGTVREQIDMLLLRGRINQDTANRFKALVSGSLTKDAFADADFVIEAVFEDLDVKKQVLRELEAVVSPECVLATNTSSLSVSGMAEDLDHPERVVGFHFFNPVAVLPLLEVVRADRTDDATLATAFAVGKQLKKSCVLVKDAPAFVVNRLLTRFLGEVTRAVDTGTPPEVADRALEPLGLPMSPFTLLELVGPPIALHVSETLHTVFPDRFAVSSNLRRLVAAGKNAIYRWDDGTPSIDPEVAELFTVEPDAAGQALDADQLRTSACKALAQEIDLMLAEGVVAEARDIDLCMLLGAGWPFHLGGITPYLDRTGIAEQVTGRRFLDQGVANVSTG